MYLRSECRHPGCELPRHRMHRCAMHAEELLDRMAPARNAAALAKRQKLHPGRSQRAERVARVLDAFEQGGPGTVEDIAVRIGWSRSAERLRALLRSLIDDQRLERSRSEQGKSFVYRLRPVKPNATSPYNGRGAR